MPSSRTPPILPLALMLFVSGASALVYQVVWQRLLSTVFGVTVYATSTVLASFMAGLAVGGLLGGRFADRVRRPLWIFAGAEAGIGMFAALSPGALSVAADAYTALQSSAGVGLAGLTAIRLVCSALLLLPPTTLMGATLPAVIAALPREGGRIRARVSLLYGANTLGALAGALGAGYMWIGAMGMAATMRLAILGNLLVAAGAAFLAWRTQTEDATTHAEAAPEPTGVALSTTQGRALLAVFALSGFVALGLEVVWFRMLVAYLPTTTYAFTSMLATVLAGIGLGAIAAARGRTSKGELGRLSVLMAATGALAVVSANVLARTYAAGWRTSGMVQACVVGLLPAATLMGVVYPRGLALWTGASARMGWRAGAFSGANLAGAILGSLAAGFLLLPSLGTRGALLLLSFLSAAGAAVLSWAEAPAHRRPALAAFIILLSASSASLPDPFAAALTRRHRGESLLWREESAQATVAVHQSAAGERVLYIDGIHQAGDSPDMSALHQRIGLLPLLLHSEPRRALVIGLAGGVTPGAMAVDDDVTIEVVELSPAVVRASDHFRHVNGDLLRRPNVHLKVDDGRNHLLLSGQRYDVITADLIQPFHAGAGNLYSREYFSLCRDALTDSGMMVQWIGHPQEAQYKLILRTFLDVFPETTLWAESVLVGAKTARRIEDAAVARVQARPHLQAALAAAGLGAAATARALLTAGPRELREFAGQGPLLTDDRPLAEYYLSIGPSRPVDLTPLREARRRAE